MCMSTQACAQAIEGHKSMRLRNKSQFFKIHGTVAFQTVEGEGGVRQRLQKHDGTPEFANDYTAGIILVGETIQLRLIMREQSSMKCAHKKARGNVLGAIVTAVEINLEEIFELPNAAGSFDDVLCCNYLARQRQ